MSEAKNNSLPFTSGLLLGSLVAAGATFLYKTDSGKKVKKVLEGYYSQAKKHLDQVIKDAKSEAKKIAADAAISQDQFERQSQIIKKKITRQLKKSTTPRRHVFSQSGKPLVK